MNVLKALMLFIVFSPVYANDVYYGLNDANVKVGQRFYCGDYPCGIVNNGGVVTEVISSKDSAILDINNSGVMVGRIVPGTTEAAAYCTSYGCVAIQASQLGFPYRSTAWRINDVGQVLISKSKYTTGFNRKLIYSECLLSNGYCTPLSNINGSTTYRYALNNMGHTGGVWFNQDQSKGFGFIQTDTVEFIEYPGAMTTTVTGLNDSGHASGYACLTMSRDYWLAGATCTTMVGFKYIDGVFVDAGTNPQDINSLDEVAE